MGKITQQHYTLAYSLGRKVYFDYCDHTDAVEQLAAIGMNKASASFSIGNLRQMLNGAAYHRAMSIPQTRCFLISIQRDDGVLGLEKAVKAFAEHLPYLRKSSGSSVPGLTALLQEFSNSLTLLPSSTDAVNDLLERPEGTKIPDRAASIGTRFKRDAKVRAYVVQRSKGDCEYCGERGFVMVGGQSYIETHHIISLAKQGPDTLGNVIALCANHHREAHFGQNAIQLEAKLHAILKALL